jgi:hypothetical protein
MIMKRFAIGLVAVAMFAGTAGAQGVKPQPLLKGLATEVSTDSLKSDITSLVGFGTRHTLSDTVSDTRGIGAARRWAEKRFKTISESCGGCFEIALPSDTVTGKRVPNPTQVVDVVAIQRGTGDPDRVIIISGHIDSRVSDVMDFTSDAPGANDDASGVAVVLEAARVLSKHKFQATIVYAVLSGEEQGLLGGKILADYAKAQGWKVEAVLNNDIVGNSRSQLGVRNAGRVRVFSEGTRTLETPEQTALRRYNGGELDSPSRNLGRFVDTVAAGYLKGFDVDMIYRTDRFGRGGDQVEMLKGGYPSVRITEGAEDYTKQHQNLRTEGGITYGDTIDGVDFAYLGQVSRLNILSLAGLASAPGVPLDVTIAGAVTPDTVLSWKPVPEAVSYRVRWRSTTDAQWRNVKDTGDVTKFTLSGVSVDDWFFGVSAVSADGFESPVVFPGAAGAF